MGRRATAQDVADLAGVSRSAVSLVLNGRGAGNISAAKQAAILEAAEQLSYSPNAVALSLRRRRTRTIGVLTWNGPGGPPGLLIDAFYLQAARAGYLILPVNVRREEELLEVLLDRQVDGLVAVAPELVEYVVPDLLSTTPTVLVNCFDPGRTASSVIPDEVGAGAAATALLHRAGHVEIGVLAPAVTATQSERRVRGVRYELASAALPEPTVVTDERDAVGGYRAAYALLTGHRPPTGVVVVHERMAVGALLAAASLGLSVPADVSIVCLDDGDNLATRLVPALTLVQRPDEAMAVEALGLLVAALANGPGVARELSFVCPVVPGDSVSPPAAPVPSR